MAIGFELYAEFKNQGSAERFIGHFQGLRHTLLNGRTISWTAFGPFGAKHASSVSVSFYSPDLGRRGIRCLQDALESTEAGLRLYHHLLSAPEFRYARVDWEAENIPLIDLHEYIDHFGEDGSHLVMRLSCVIDEALFEELGRPTNMRPFRPGYYWNPYRGESYRPLGSIDQPELWQLRAELLPPS